MGALCLNQAGLDQLTNRPTIIPAIFSIFISERHQRVLQEKENAVLIGTSIEELIRHHPSLKDRVFEAIKSIMSRIEDLGNQWVCPDDLKQWYMLQPAPSTSEQTTAEETDVVMEGTDGAETSAPDAGTSAEPASSPLEELVPPKSHDNIITSFIDVFCKVLSYNPGLFSN